MKYIKGTQTYPLSYEDKTAPTWKVNLVCNGDAEGIWVKQGDKEVVLLNHALAFYPFPSWGVVIPSTRDDKDTSQNRERIDITTLRGDSPADTVLTLHPEAWDQYIEHGQIDTDGNFITGDKPSRLAEQSIVLEGDTNEQSHSS